MVNRIPQEIIEEVMQRADIVEIVGEYVALRRRGRNYFGLCPFHHEDTPWRTGRSLNALAAARAEM